MRFFFAAFLAVLGFAAVSRAQVPESPLMQPGATAGNCVMINRVVPPGTVLGDAGAPCGGTLGCSTFTNSGNLSQYGGGNFYYASGALNPGDFLSLIFSSTAVSMTLAAGTVNGHPITIGLGTQPATPNSTLTLNLNGTSTVVSLTNTQQYRFAWNAGLSTWTQC